MVLEFKTYELKEESGLYKNIVQSANKPNEFIIVGEELIGKEIDCFKVQHVGEKGISLISALTIDESALLVPKEDLKLKKDDLPGYEIQEIDIPREYLTMDIIESIQRLNS